MKFNLNTCVIPKVPNSFIVLGVYHYHWIMHWKYYWLWSFTVRHLICMVIPFHSGSKHTRLQMSWNRNSFLLLFHMKSLCSRIIPKTHSGSHIEREYRWSIVQRSMHLLFASYPILLDDSGCGINQATSSYLSIRKSSFWRRSSVSYWLLHSNLFFLTSSFRLFFHLPIHSLLVLLLLFLIVFSHHCCILYSH